MQTLSPQQTEQASGGIAWTTPVAIALADTASLGPLGTAFGFGYGIGTLVYDHFLADRLTF